MATAKPKYNDEKDYTVTFAKVVKHKGTTLRPRSTYPVIKGRVLNALDADAIASAVPVSA